MFEIIEVEITRVDCIYFVVLNFLSVYFDKIYSHKTTEISFPEDDGQVSIDGNRSGPISHRRFSNDTDALSEETLVEKAAQYRKWSFKYLGVTC